MQEHIFERMARERNISVEEMRAIISDRIEKGWNDEDPEKREQWRKIPCAGERPTPDEWLSYVIKKINDDGQGNLLRKYLIWQLHIECHTPDWRGGTAHAERGSQPEDRPVKVLGAEIDFPTLLAAGVPYLVDTAPAISPAPFVRRYSNGRAFQLAIVKILIEQIEHLRYLQNDYIFKDIFYFCESQLTHHRLKSKL